MDPNLSLLQSPSSWLWFVPSQPILLTPVRLAVLPVVGLAGHLPVHVSPAGEESWRFWTGGGASVLATDDCAVAGFVLPPLPREIKQAFRNAVGNDAGTILGNPIDFLPMVSSNEASQEILRKLFAWEGIDFILFQAPLRGIMLPLPVASALFDSQIGNFIKVGGQSSKPLAMVINYLTSGESWQAAASFRRKCCEAGLPVYHSIASATLAIDRFLRYHQHKR